MIIKEGELTLCTVDKIVGTTVFIKTEDGEEGTIVTSEIAPGRIRNLRDYVIPNKKIVCKILKIDGKNIHLSLRRVTAKERKEVIDNYKREKTSLSILKSVLKEKAEETAEKIKKTSSLNEFLQNCKISPKELEKHMNKEQAAQICKILSEKKEKLKEVKKELKLSSIQPNGIKIIKQILSECKGNCEIIYIAAGKYLIKQKSKNYKQAEKIIDETLEQIRQQAKSAKADFEVIEIKK